MGEKKANIISILNLKGGVGKTTLSCNIGVELAKKGKKVLIIDMDPQFNTTQTLFKYYCGNVKKYRELEDEGKTLFGVLNDKKVCGISNKNKIKKEYVYKFENKTLDIIPGDLRLIMEINNQAGDGFKSYIKKNKFKEIYDYIIIDCPPTWGTLTSISLDISDYYLIPSKLDEFSTVGITLLGQLMEEKVNALPENQLKCLGVVYMMLNETKAQSGISPGQNIIKKEIEEYFEEMSKNVKSEVKSFDTVFHYSKALATESVVYRDSENNIKAKSKTQEKKQNENKDKIVELVKDIDDRIKKMNE